MEKAKVKQKEPIFYDGIFWLPAMYGNIKDQLEDIKNMDIRSDDIIIATYPRSGTHWVNEIVTMLVNGSTEYPDELGTSAVLEFCPVSSFQDLKSPRIPITHLPAKYMPLGSEKGRVIYVARNPKDVAVSMHCVQLDSNTMSYHGDWNRFFQEFVTGKCPLGSWFDHVIPYIKWINGNKNAMFVKYEDMKKNLKEGILQIAKFLGVNHDEKLIDEIAAAVDFKALKAKRDKDMSEATKAMSKTGNNFFYRKGKVADWKNWFTVAQNEQFDQMYEEKMKNTGLTFDFVL